MQSVDGLPMKMTTTGSGGTAAGSIDDEAFARIKMGVNVDIKRSDGKTERYTERARGANFFAGCLGTYFKT